MILHIHETNMGLSFYILGLGLLKTYPYQLKKPCFIVLGLIMKINILIKYKIDENLKKTIMKIKENDMDWTKRKTFTMAFVTERFYRNMCVVKKTHDPIETPRVRMRRKFVRQWWVTQERERRTSLQGNEGFYW